jgi:hypothetical protein
MGLTSRKEEQLRQMPIIRSSVSRSKDNKYIIQRTTITSIKPTTYYKAVVSGEMQVVEEDIAEELKEFA